MLMDIQPFDSSEEFMRSLRRDMDAADARVQPWQVAIKPGDHFRRESEYGFPIYGVVLNEDEPREQHVRHYRLCNCYSIACPEGEIGDIHVCTIDELINQCDFDSAKQRAWNP